VDWSLLRWAVVALVMVAIVALLLLAAQQAAPR